MAGVNTTIGVLKPHERLDGVDLQATKTWRKILRWIIDVVVLPCNPFFPLLPLLRRGPHVVSGTLLWRPDDVDKKVTLCLHGAAAGPPLLFVDLPLGRLELAEAGRVALECDQRWAGTGGAGALLAEPKWAVHCNGRRAGFTGRRAPTEGEAAMLEALASVSAGIGKLTTESDGGAGEILAYLRGAFERVVGSSDCESYHLADRTGSLGLDLSLFFLRVR